MSGCLEDSTNTSKTSSVQKRWTLVNVEWRMKNASYVSLVKSEEWIVKNRADAVGGLLATNKTTKQQDNQTTWFLVKSEEWIVKNRADALWGTQGEERIQPPPYRGTRGILCSFCMFINKWNPRQKFRPQIRDSRWFCNCLMVKVLGNWARKRGVFRAEKGGKSRVKA